MTAVPGTVERRASLAVDRDRSPVRRRRPKVDRWALLLVPGTLYLVVIFMYPLAGMVIRSFTEPAVGFDNYARFFANGLTTRSLGSTFQMAFITTAACVLVGYPYAYAMATSTTRVTAILAAAVVVPQFVSFLVRIFAIDVMLRDTGIINDALAAVGIARLPLIRNQFSVTLGMVSMLLPVFILPLYAVMRRVDPDYVKAAAILGAPPLRAFVRVFVPLTVPGLAGGCLLVFTFALGYYITPAILGSGTSLYLPQLVVQYMGKLEWGFASAISMVLLGTCLLLIAVTSRVVNIRDVFGVGIER